MNNFNWQSFLRDNSEFFRYKQKVKFPTSDYDIDKEAADLDVKAITRICNRALVDFLKKQAKTGDVGTFNSAIETEDDESRNSMIKPDTEGAMNKEIKPKENMDNLVDHAGICAELTNTYRKKNADYGNSFSRAVEKYGLVSALTRISDKFNRLESLILHKEQEVKDESVQDTLLDLANYCIMTVMEIRKNGIN